MNRKRQRSLRGQMISVLILGLLLSHGAGFLLYTLDRREAVSTTEAFDIAERASGVIGLLRRVPENWRGDVLNAADSRAFRVWASETAAIPAHESSDQEQEVLDYLRVLLPRLADREMRLSMSQALPAGVTPPSRAWLSGAPSGGLIETAAEIVTISVHHPDGFWINFVGAVPKSAAFWPRALAGYLIALVVGIALIALLIVRGATQPLADFAAAAERLGKDIETAPLSEDAPKEVARAARAFNQMQERLARLVQTRTEFLAAVSHDLRTPITQLKLRTESMEDGEEREKYAAALEEMDQIIATFLDYARSAYGAEPRSHIDLGSLVESVCNDMGDAGANIAYSGGGLIRLHGKRLALKRAVTNIVENAVKYAGGARVSAQRRDGDIVIRVDDDGPGVPEADLRAVLAPFRRGDPSRNRLTGGAGLGLSIAQAVAHDHGGEVVLSNRSEGGLRAEMILPG